MLIRANYGTPGTDITPSNTSPVSLMDGETYTVNGNGHAIESYNNVTPSTSGESVSTGIWKVNGTGGYLYSSRPISVVTGTEVITYPNYSSSGNRQEYDFDTGLSYINTLLVHFRFTPDTIAQNYIQQFIRYERSFGNNYYTLSARQRGSEDSNVAVYDSMGISQANYYARLVQITNGQFKIVNPANWAGKFTVTWWAW